MGLGLLVLGLALWVLAHGFKRYAPERRAAMGDSAKGAVAISVLAGVVLMVIGFRMTETYDLASPPPFLRHINNLLMLVAIFLLSPAPKRGRVASGMRHPMLTGFSLWVLSHLLVNWDVASFTLFGGLLICAIAEVIVINRAEPEWTPGERGTYAKDAMFLAGSVVILFVIGWIHAWLGYLPLPNLMPSPEVDDARL